MRVTGWVLGAVQTNCYCVYNEGEDSAVIIDPGDNGDIIGKRLEDKGLKAGAILLTHSHFDHIGGVKELVTLFNCPVYACEDERELCESAELNLSLEFGRGLTLENVTYLPDGHEIDACGLKCTLIETPGHTKGSCCYYFRDEDILFTGDTLFFSSVGRTDFPTGSSSTLVRSVKEKLLVLPDDTVCYPGHGEATTIGTERSGNPFII